MTDATTAGLEPWARQPGESTRAYAAFAVYRDLGPTRSLAAVGRQLRGDAGGLDEDRKPAPGHLTGWSAKHRWGERAAAYDAHVEAAKQEAIQEAARNKGRAWAEREDQILEEDWALAQRIRGMVARAIQARPVPQGDGTTSMIEPEFFGQELRHLIATAVAASDLARSAVDRATEKAIGSPVASIDDEVRRRAEQKLAAWKQRMRESLRDLPSEPPGDSEDEALAAAAPPS